MDLTALEMADLINSFISGGGSEWDWDEFLSIKITDPLLDEVRIACIQVQEQFPPTEENSYCSREGMLVLNAMTNNSDKLPGEIYDQRCGSSESQSRAALNTMN